MGIHSNSPFCAVVHIAEDVGAQGGPLWRLRLECGHTAFRPRRVPRVEDSAWMLGAVIAMSDKTPRLPKFTAPKRVKCLFCGLHPQPQAAPADGGSHD